MMSAVETSGDESLALRSCVLFPPAPPLPAKPPRPSSPPPLRCWSRLRWTKRSVSARTLAALPSYLRDERHIANGVLGKVWGAWFN